MVARKETTNMNVYEVVTTRIIAQLEAGTVPWRRPWPLAANLISRKAYRGINRLLLGSCDSYSSPYWLTFKQALALGGNVRKGEHGAMVVFWKDTSAKPGGDDDSETGGADDSETTRRRFILRYYYVFNIEQCEKIPADKIPAAPDGADVDAAAEAIAARYLADGGPELVHGGARACYSVLADRVQMPARDIFSGTAEYYSTLFHELTHSTGHAKRLAREELGKMAAFGETDYAAEELTAELGSAMLCSVAGVEPQAVQDNQAAYIAGWLQALRNDPRAVVTAASRAQRAADYIQGVQA
jgi:antirestriction protein ArdC